MGVKSKGKRNQVMRCLTNIESIKALKATILAMKQLENNPNKEVETMGNKDAKKKSIDNEHSRNDVEESFDNEESRNEIDDDK